MQAKNRRKLLMASRVLDFFRAYPSDQPSYRVAIRKLEECCARAEELVKSRHEGGVRLEAATRRREELSSFVGRDLIPRLLRAGQAVATVRPDLVELFRGIHGAANRGFVLAAGRILAQADPILDRSLLADLAAVAEELGRVLNTIDESERAVQHQARELARNILEMSRLIAKLDGLNRHRFRGDGQLQEEWAAARNLASPFRPRSGLRKDDGRAA